MRNLREIMLGLAVTIAAGLVFYEIVCKSDVWLDAPLPGWIEAQTAERRTPYVPVTGKLSVDLLIHEGQEAACYYSLFLRRGPRSLSLASRSPSISR